MFRLRMYECGQIGQKKTESNGPKQNQGLSQFLETSHKSQVSIMMQACSWVVSNGGIKTRLGHPLSLSPFSSLLILLF